MTSVPGVFSCGNVLHVHDLVDHVSEEAELAGRFAVEYLDGGIKSSESYIHIESGEGVRYVLPQKVSGTRDFTLSMRVAAPSRNQVIWVKDSEKKIARKKMVRLHPAEMVRIKVKANKLESAKRLSVSVK
jgi:uncharacterized cupredoxin-like copper-binding protein